MNVNLWPKCRRVNARQLGRHQTPSWTSAAELAVARATDSQCKEERLTYEGVGQSRWYRRGLDRERSTLRAPSERPCS